MNRSVDAKSARRSGGRRRRALALVTAGVAVATLGVTPAAVAASEVTANATGRVIAVAPVSGGLSLELGLGSAIADLKGTTPRAESATLKPGIVGLLLGSTLPLPKPAKADLRGEKSVDRGSVAPAVDAGALRLTATRERASVTSDEDEGGMGATARTDLSDVVVAGVVEVSGGTAGASATKKLAEGTSSVARLVVKVGGATLLDLNGLEWRVSAKLGEKPTATFSIGSAIVQGARQAIDSPEELRAALEPLAPVLAPAGVSIILPAVTETKGGAILSPLFVQSVNAPALRSTVGAVYPEIAPIYNELATQLQGQAAEAGLALLAANVGLSVAAGNGGARLALGGASAAIEPRESFGGSSDFGGSSSGGSLSSGAGAGSSGSAASVAPSAAFFADSDAERTVRPAPSVTSGFSPSGAVASSVPAPASAASPVAARPTSAPAGGGPRSIELAAVPLSESGESSVPAALVLALLLAGVCGLAARDQLSAERRDALRLARARSSSAV